MTTQAPVPSELGQPVVERGETGIRILLTILYAVAFRVASILLFAIVIFELGWSLVTRQVPHDRVRALANRILSYMYETTRFMSYNLADRPFPLSDFPPELESVPSADELYPDVEDPAERAPAGEPDAD
jgi:hypothetical protein